MSQPGQVDTACQFVFIQKCALTALIPTSSLFLKDNSKYGTVILKDKRKILATANIYIVFRDMNGIMIGRMRRLQLYLTKIGRR